MVLLSPASPESPNIGMDERTVNGCFLVSAQAPEKTNLLDHDVERIASIDPLVDFF
jgi:hypothetical protein